MWNRIIVLDRISSSPESYHATSCCFIVATPVSYLCVRVSYIFCSNDNERLGLFWVVVSGVVSKRNINIVFM